MTLPVFSARDYLEQFQRLLPRGRIWHRGWGQVQDADLLVLMPAWVRLHLRLNDLIFEIFPCTTIELLPEWEETLGLPDPCIGPLETIQERQAAVCIKFTAQGGQSKAYYIAVAASLGFEITIQEFAPFRASHNSADDPCAGDDWAHTWRVVAINQGMTWFSAGVSNAGEPLRAWNNRVLECVLEAIKPAHTVLLFAYTGSLWDEGESQWDLNISLWDRHFG